MNVYGACLLLCLCIDGVGVCGNVCCASVIVKDSGFCNLGVLKCVVCLCKGCDGCHVFCLCCDAWSCMCSCMGSMNVLSCRCCMFMSCVYPLTVFNPVAPYGYLLPNVYLFMENIANPVLFVCVCRTWICLDSTRFIRSSASNQRVPMAGLPPKR